MCLYKTWSHTQAPIIALVFLAGCYTHALDLVHEISKHEVTIDFLLELDRFIQTLESPMFACKYTYYCSRSRFSLILQGFIDHIEKLRVVYAPVTVHVNLDDHRLNFLFCQGFTQV